MLRHVLLALLYLLDENMTHMGREDSDRSLALWYTLCLVA